MLNNIISAIKAYVGTLSLISKLKLWQYFAIPILISMITAISIFVLAYGLSDNIGGAISSIWKWDFGKSTFSTIGAFLGGASVVLIGLVLYKHIVLALSSPFMSPVSEKIENHFKGADHEHKITSFQEQLIRGVRVSLRNVGKELLFTIPLLLLSWIPVVGWCFAVLSFLIQAYYAGFGNIDYTLERHFTYKQSVAFVRKHKGMAIGNGIVFMLFLLIPFIGMIIVLPLSVTAATTETIKKLK